MKLTILYRALVFVVLIYTAIPCYATPVIIVLGDSLSAGFGIQQSQSWVALLSDKLKKDNHDYLVINGSVSGATTADGLNVLPQLLSAYSPQIVILALGSNDGLRGNPILTIQQNLESLIGLCTASSAKVLMVGFQLPPNYGTAYRDSFKQVFIDVSAKNNLPLVPFLLEGFQTNLKYFQADQLHPTAQAQPIMLRNVWEYLQPML